MSTFDIEADLAALFELRPGAVPAMPLDALPTDPRTIGATFPVPAAACPGDVPPRPPTPPLPTLPTTARAAAPIAAAPVSLQPTMSELTHEVSTSHAASSAAVPGRLSRRERRAQPKSPKTKTEAKTKTKRKTKPQAPAKTKPQTQQRTSSGTAGRGGRVVKLGLIVLLIGGGAGAAYAVRSGVLSDKASSPADVDTPAAPASSDWDPRVADLVAFVEATRELTFKYPVAIDVLTDDEFVAFVATDQGLPDQAMSAEQLAALFDARGLTVTAAEAEQAMAGSDRGLLGLYSFTEDRIVVRTDQFTPAVKAMLVHELTHALQAQHFELAPSSANNFAIEAVLEGDAERMQSAYLATLDAGEAFGGEAEATVAEEQGEAAEPALDDSTDLPWMITTKDAAPWVLGSRLVNLAFDSGGNAAVDDLFRNPATEERLVSPWLDTPLAVDTVVDVAAPAGATVIEMPGSLGLFDTVVMLDAWLPWTQTRQAINGWSGSGYTSYTRADGAVCFAAAVSFDADPIPFAEAVSAWAVAAGSAAKSTISGSTVSFEACNRGDGAPTATEPFFSPLDAMFVEYDAVVAGGAVATPEGVEAALCYAGRKVDDPAVVALLSGDQITEEQQAALDYLKQANSEICGYVANSVAG